MKNGSKITLRNAGDAQPDKIPGDVVYNIMVADHDTYIRYGDNLATTITVTLVEALTGFVYMLKHLDGDEIPITFDEICQPKQVLRVAGKVYMFIYDDFKNFSMCLRN